LERKKLPGFLENDGQDSPPFFGRLSPYMVLVAIALIALVALREKLPAPSFWFSAVGAAPTVASPPAEPVLPLFPSGEALSAVPSPTLGFTTSPTGESGLPAYPDLLVRAAMPHTIIPDRPRLSIITYTVQPGDTVFGIAETFGISPETVLWANGDLEYHPDDLSIGQELNIPPVSGVYYTVQAGDSLEKLAKTFQVTPEDILSYPLNEIGPDGTLSEGQKLIIPNGVKPYVPRRVQHYAGPIPEDASKGTGAFGWPASGRITQGYWSLHRAIDIGAPSGTPVYASDSGYVVFAGWDDSGYGNIIIINHGNGYLTYYAHLSKILVAVGNSVSKGSKIGQVGSTGRSTGSHLHFEIRQHDIQRNPIGFLP